ncbi:MAG TPA: DMT family transporter [Bacillota bacterium]|jgi:drug/metabolite transporter (DMT)-like permease|nr:DMT family transporter [Bacillota bacterium]HQE67137.1 DMT family transporter [Bacillota bacterium]HQI16527.1 DMT family transporter [Bacillota bacterium]HQJ37361.1 DMT family transporter [Bacillota bacterium]HQL36073.1 DMT family transporter [Bacillota bacterium]
MKKSLKADLALLLVTIFWGAGFPATKIALQTMTPYYHIGIRFAVASLLLSLLFFKKLRNLNKSLIKPALILSSLLFATYAFQTVGIQYTTASKSGFFSGLAVLIVPLFSIFYQKTKLELKTIISVVTATLGLFLLSYTGSDFNFNIGDFLTILCSICYAWQLLFTGTYVQKHDATLLAIVQLFFVSLYGMAFAVILEPIPANMSVPSFWSLMFSAVFCTAFAFWMQTTAQKFTAASHIALIFTMEPVFGALTSFLLLNEVLGAMGIIGGILIVSAMIISEFQWTKSQTTSS